MKATMFCHVSNLKNTILTHFKSCILGHLNDKSKPFPSFGFCFTVVKTSLSKLKKCSIAW